MQFLIRERLRGLPPPGGVKSRGVLLLELARELRDLRDELEEKRGKKSRLLFSRKFFNTVIFKFPADRDNTTSEPFKKEVSSMPPPSTDVPKNQQRPSLISIFTGAGTQPPSSQVSVQHDSRSGVFTPSDTLSQQTLHPPRESLSSSSTTTNKEPGVTSETLSGDGTTPTPSINANAPTIISRASSIRRPKDSSMSGSVPHLSHSVSMQPSNHPMKAQPPRLRFVSSVEFKHSSGETSTTPLSPDSPADDSSSENHKPSRLQRSKAQSRKTFRYKRGRPSHYGHGEGSSLSSNTTQVSVQQVAPATQPQHHLLQTTIEPEVSAKQNIGDISWDSVSQTSSTSGYRDNYSLQTGLLSPDGSLTGVAPVIGMDRTSSHNSLLMLFETQDEDTLI